MNLRFDMNQYKFALILLVIVILPACGQKGDLTIPDKQVSAVLPSPSQ